MKKFFLFAAMTLFFAFVMYSCSLLKSVAGVQENTLLINDVAPELGTLSGQLNFNGVKYSVANEPEYDAFFLSVAKLNALTILSKNYSDYLVNNLNVAVKEVAAISELNSQIDEITEGKPEEQWTTQEKLAVLKTAKQRNKNTGTAFVGFLKTATSLGSFVSTLTKSVNTISDITTQGTNLTSKVSSLPSTKVPAVTISLKDAVSNLSNISIELPETIKNMNVLYQGISEIL